MLGLALMGRLVTIPLPIPFLGDLALLVGLAGMFTLILGTKAFVGTGLRSSSLCSWCPCPLHVLADRLAVAIAGQRVASTVMNLTGVPVLCEGNRITLPGGVQLFVAEACSGMRQMTGFLALTAAVAYLTARPAWYRVDHCLCRITDRLDRQRGPHRADWLHHAFRQSRVRIGHLSHSRGNLDDGLRAHAARLRLLAVQPVLPELVEERWATWFRSCVERPTTIVDAASRSSDPERARVDGWRNPENLVTFRAPEGRP